MNQSKKGYLKLYGNQIYFNTVLGKQIINYLENPPKTLDIIEKEDFFEFIFYKNQHGNYHLTNGNASTSLQTNKGTLKEVEGLDGKYYPITVDKNIVKIINPNNRGISKKHSTKRRNLNYTKGYLIEKLKKKAKELGRTPKIKDLIEDDDMPSPGYYQTKFGYYNEAIEEAGLKPNKTSARGYNGQNINGHIEEIIQREWKNGKSLEEISNKVGVSRPSVRRRVDFTQRYEVWGEKLKKLQGNISYEQMKKIMGLKSDNSAMVSNFVDYCNDEIDGISITRSSNSVSSSKYYIHKKDLGYEKYRKDLPEDLAEIFNKYTGKGRRPSSILASFGYLRSNKSQKEITEEYDISEVGLRDILKVVCKDFPEEKVHESKIQFYNKYR